MLFQYQKTDKIVSDVYNEAFFLMLQQHCLSNFVHWLFFLFVPNIRKQNNKASFRHLLPGVSLMLLQRCLLHVVHRVPLAPAHWLVTADWWFVTDHWLVAANCTWKTIHLGMTISALIWVRLIIIYSAWWSFWN